MRTIRKVCLPLLLLAAIPVLGQEKPVQAQPSPVYQVYAIRYATLPAYPVSDLVTGAAPDRKLDIAMMIWLVRGNGHNVLLDAGFYHDRLFKEWEVRDYIKPSDALARVGLKPEDITDVIISHMHWDHVDGADLFPNARIWVQRDELEYYAGQAWQTKEAHDGFDAGNVQTLVKLNTEGRVGLVQGDAQEIIPGITCYTGGKHTHESQYIGVETAGGVVILASDNLYLYENLEKHAAIGETVDAAANLRAQGRMMHLAAKPELIIPGHDPAVFTKFPNPTPGVARIQ
jgi:glyoxylase-like metal-dependent hydrolase (beta-lactamase superfamily II)